MKKIELDFISRFKLSGILAEVDGTLAKIAPLLKVFEQIRFTEEEAKQIVSTTQGDRTIFSTPDGNPDFGKLSVELEDSHCTALLQEIEGWPKFKLSDLQWVEKLKAGLK